ncbi:MAG TPA: sulfotransferase domain-containing protein [Aestuariivirgaceae bacterium]|nr:sulfotransferase domain-containing protein [Aestuariivirgaceae bacterium]
MLIRSAKCSYRTWILDSSRWDRYRSRDGDIVIGTYPKSGTTWLQQIVSLLIFQSTEPRPIQQDSPWIDRRFPETLESLVDRLEAQTHRRFLKSHLPIDGLPLYDEVRYIHVARSGLDAFMSFHNHCTAYTSEMLANLDRAGVDDPAIARPYPHIDPDPAAFFRSWISEGVVPGQDDGRPGLSYFAFERSWWEVRQRPNLLFVHYNDLKTDLAGEMRRIADFLGITVPSDLWPEMVEAASFEAMRRHGDLLLGGLARMFQGGAARFLFKATNERWRDVLSEDDLARYQAKVETMLSPACAQWLAHGGALAGDPRLAA